MRYYFSHKISAYGLVSLLLSSSLNAQAPMMPTTQALSGPKLLAVGKSEQTISLKEAFDRALANHSQLLLIKNQLERRRVEKAIRIGAILPKVRLGAAYTRNIPEVESSLFNNSGSSSLSHHVAGLLRASGDLAAADEVMHQANLGLRRNGSGKIVISPKDAFDGKLTLEVPLFNGPDIARILASNENVLLLAAKVDEEQASTIYTTAKAYYLVVHLKNVLTVREQAEAFATERFAKAESEKKRGAIIESDYLQAKANLLQKQAERHGAMLDYRSAIGDLGIILGVNEEFTITAPDDFMFEALTVDTDRLIETAIINRPDLKAEQQAMKVVQHERLGHFLQFLPTLTLQGDAKYTSNDQGMLGKNFSYAISLNASVAIFDGGIGFSQLRETTLKRQESEIKIRQLKVEIETKVRGRKEKLVQLVLSEQAWYAKTIAAKESELVAQSRHKMGIIDQQELLDVTDRKLAADIAHRKSQSDLNEEKLALIYEAGLLTPQFLNN